MTNKVQNLTQDSIKWAGLGARTDDLMIIGSML